MSDIGAISPARWQVMQLAYRIGATSLLNVGAAAAGVWAACAGRANRHAPPSISNSLFITIPSTASRACATKSPSAADGLVQSGRSYDEDQCYRGLMPSSNTAETSTVQMACWSRVQNKK